MASWSALESSIHAIRAVVPKLTQSMHKGQAGRIGVVGGCFEYTGAPYFAAISALKLGADLSHIFCTPGAATAIKSYSPELIVHPVLPERPTGSAVGSSELAKNAAVSVGEWLQRLHVLVIGPGLGRDPLVQETAFSVLQQARDMSLPVILDGDGLALAAARPSCIEGYNLAVLTPNVVEFKRLVGAVFPQWSSADHPSCQEVSKRLGNVTIVQKGATDIISDGLFQLECSTGSSPRRCGGQGDVLAGSIAVFISWARECESRNPGSVGVNFEGVPVSSLVFAAYSGCFFTRFLSQAAFSKHDRSMTTTDLIAEIPTVVKQLFPAAGG